MAKGDIIIVDTETTGLIPSKHVPFEVSWVKWNPADPMVPKTFYLELSEEALDTVDPKALEVNGWTLERLASLTTDIEAVNLFLRSAEGSTLMGANVRYDARMLEKVFNLEPEPWHYRLFDIEAYIAGTFGLDHVPGNAEIRKLIETVELNVTGDAWAPTKPDHTSANDVRAVRDFYAWCLWASYYSFGNAEHPSKMDLG